MKLKIFAIKDIKAKNLCSVFLDKDVLAAKRQIGVVVNSNNQSMYRVYPGEFQLLQLGSVDMVSGFVDYDFDEICVLDELKSIQLENTLNEVKEEINE